MLYLLPRNKHVYVFKSVDLILPRNRKTCSKLKRLEPMCSSWGGEGGFVVGDGGVPFLLFNLWWGSWFFLKLICNCQCFYAQQIFLISFPGLEKNLNSSLPFGQVALKFCLPWASLRLLFLRFSWQTTCPLASGNEKWLARQENLLVPDIPWQTLVESILWYQLQF